MNIIKVTKKIKLIPTKEQEHLIQNTMKEYIKTVNDLVATFVLNDEALKLTSKDVVANIPSALKNQCIRDAKSVFNKYKKAVKTNLKKGKTTNVPILKREVAIYNNQNFKVKKDKIEFPVMINNKSKRLKVKALIPEDFINSNLGTLRLSYINNKLIAQITYEETEKSLNLTEHIMGVDLGIKVPAVAKTDNRVKFFGNGRKNKYLRRIANSKRKELQKSKNIKKLKQIDNKEQRIMNDIDHKISRQIVNFAKNNNITLIKLETLSNIRQTTRTSRKNNKSLHNWSFYRLAMYIEYKAKLEGISVEYINPKYTSQICPNCGIKNKVKDRLYKCACGFKTHRDIVGAINIKKAPILGGKSLIA